MNNHMETSWHGNFMEHHRNIMEEQGDFMEHHGNFMEYMETQWNQAETKLGIL